MLWNLHCRGEFIRIVSYKYKLEYQFCHVDVLPGPIQPKLNSNSTWNLESGPPNLDPKNLSPSKKQSKNCAIVEWQDSKVCVFFDNTRDSKKYNLQVSFIYHRCEFMLISQSTAINSRIELHRGYKIII